MGSVLAPFRPSGPLCFPVRQRAFSASGGRAAAATGAAGGFYVSLCLIVQTAVQKMVENYCFSRVSEGALQFLGSILAPFRPSGPLCFPVRQRAFSTSGGRAAAATGAAGGFYVSLCLIVQTAVQKLVENYCFSRVSEGTLGSFWARFWRRSVLQGPLCFPVRQRAFSASGGRAAAATGAAGGFYVSLCLIVQTAVQKMVENYCFSRVSEGTLGSFWARFSVLQGYVSVRSVRFQLREEEQQQQQEQQEGSMSHYVSCTNSGTKNGRKLLFFSQKGR